MPGEDDPPGHLVPNGVGHLAGLHLAHHADDHAGDDLDQAQGQRAHQNGQCVVEGGEQGWKLGECGVGVDDLGQLGNKVAQEAAGQRAHDKGADAAQQQQTGKVPHTALGPHDAEHKDGAQDHQNAVCHIRHHQPKEENEEGGHQRIGVHAVIGGENIHIGDHVERPGQRIVLELDRHGGVFLWLGIRGFPRGGVPAQERLQTGRLSAGTQPSRKMVVWEARSRPLTSSRWMSWVIRSMQSFRSSRWTTSPEMAALPRPPAPGPNSARRASIRSVLARAVPSQPRREEGVKPKPFKRSRASSSAFRWQRRSTY